MKVLITGITGFVGQNLRCHLPDGHEYFVVARSARDINKNFTVIQGDLNNLNEIKKQLAQIKPDACVHLAWEDIPDYGYETSSKNLRNSTDLFRFLVKECECRKIVSTGSCWEYGKSFGPCAEMDALDAGSYFTWAKRALCDLGLSMAGSEKINFVWLRLFYVYGPGQREAALIPTLVETLKKKQCPSLRTPLDANDFIHIDDVIQALLKSVFNEVPTGIYNVGSGASLPIWRVCEIIEQELKMNTDYFKEIKKAFTIQTADFWANTKLSSQVLDWQPGKAMENGIREYLKGQGVSK